MGDEELLHGLRCKNEAAFGKLTDLYMRYVAAIISKLARSRGKLQKLLEQSL